MSVINGLVDNFLTQKTSAGANQMAAAEMKEIDKKEDEKKTDDRNYIQKFMDTKGNKNSGRQVLADLVAKMAGAGVKLDAESFISKAQQSAKDEYDMMFKSDEDSSDSVDIKSSTQKILAAKRLKQGRGGKQGQDQQDPAANAQKIGETISEFSGAFVEFIISGGNENKKKANKLEKQLKLKGMKNSDILSLKQSIKKQIRSQLAAQMKESLLKKMFSKEKTLDHVLNNKEFFRSVEMAFNSDKLGGWDFGGFKGSLQGTVDEAGNEARSEIRDFVKDEMKAAVVKKNLGDQNADNEIKELVRLGKKSGMNFNLLKFTCQKSAYDVGICPPPPEAFQQSMLGSGSQGKKEQTGYEFTQDDEKELLVNQLRSLYMQRAVRGNLRTNIETSFKIRKLKNGMIKLGITFADFDKLEMEGRALGRVKLLEMLKEALHERATLYALAGPAFQMIEKKMKGLLKNLLRMGMDLSKTELDALRDQANYDMFDVARNELENSIVLYEGTRDPRLEKKIKLTIKLLQRLKEESNIETDYDPELRFFKVAEAA